MEQGIYDNSVGKIDIPASSAQGDILIRNATVWTRLPAGTNGYFLKTLGAGASPAWAAAPAAGGGSSDYVLGTDQGMVADGVTDNHTAFLTAIAAAVAANKPLLLTPGTYKFADVVADFNTPVRIVGRDAILDFSSLPVQNVVQDMLYCMTFNNSGGQTATTTTLTADTTAGATSISVTSAAGFAVGDYIKVYDNYAINSGLIVTDGTGNKKGEIARISAINGTTISLEEALDQGLYTTARSAGIAKMTMKDGLTFDGITLKGMGTLVSPGLNTYNNIYTPIAFLIVGARNVKFNNCTFIDWPRACFTIWDCLDVDYNHCTFNNIAQDGFGYSISIDNACDNIHVQDCRFEQLGRHYISISSGSSQPGWPKRTIIDGCSFYDCAMEAINTHSPHWGPLQITDCSFIGCEKAANVFMGSMIFSGNYVANQPIGVQTENASTGEATPYLIANNIFRKVAKCVTYANAIYQDNVFIESGVQVDGQTIAANKPQMTCVIIKGNTFRSCTNDKAIDIVGNATTKILNPVIENNIFLDCDAGQYVRVNNTDYAVIRNNYSKDCAQWMYTNTSTNLFHDSNLNVSCGGDCLFDTGTTRITPGKGSATFSGTGSALTFNIAHGLHITPTFWQVIPGSNDAAAYPFYVTATATNLVVTYPAGHAPANASNNLTYLWTANL
jgi:hypothetical protein